MRARAIPVAVGSSSGSLAKNARGGTCISIVAKIGGALSLRLEISFC